MSRPLRFTLVLVAAAMHLVAPVVAFGQPSQQASPNDFCTTVRSAAPAPISDGIPKPSPHERHCALAPCCSASVLAAAAPPLAFALPIFAPSGDANPLTTTTAAPVAPIVAAQPRGPPLQA